MSLGFVLFLMLRQPHGRGYHDRKSNRDLFFKKHINKVVDICRYLHTFNIHDFSSHSTPDT